MRHLHARMKSIIAPRKSDGEVVLSNCAFLSVEMHVVTGEPSFIFEDSGSIDQRPRIIDIHVAIQRTRAVYKGVL